MSNFNSMEAFAEWFDENIKSLEECEAEGVDIEYVMKEWCCKNNHDYNDYDDSRRIGVYNNNTDDTWTCEYCGDKINNEIKDCGCNNTYDTTACPCEYCDKIHPFSECEYLETKCGCEIITNSREHDECRCDDDGENWICSDCYKGEYDEEEEQCYGKHCSETQGLKLCVGWNMNYCLDNKRFTQNLFCDYCEKLNCYTACVWCSENYKLTDMVYRCGGGFTDKDAYGNKCMFCKDCIDIIEKRLEC